MANHLLHAHAQDDPLLARVAFRITAVSAGQRLDAFQCPVEIGVHLDRSAHADPLQARLEQQADPRILLQLPVLQPPHHRVHHDDVGAVRVEVEPHHRLVGRPVSAVDGKDGVAQLAGEPGAQVVGQDGLNRQVRIAHMLLHRRRTDAMAASAPSFALFFSLALHSAPMTNAELLSIGAELLLGETVDTNAAFLGRELAEIGLPLRHARMLPDDRAAIRDAFIEARARSAVILATGGLGPTHDDLSREGLADALDEPMTEDPELLAILEERFSALGPMPASNRRQATLIPSAMALPNPIGSAPGWWAERDGVVLALMPGVPSEMRRMWAEQVRPRLERAFALPPLAMRTVKAFGIGESAMAERLGELISIPPPGVDIGIYARDDGVHVRFSTHEAPSLLEPLVAETMARLGESVYGTDDDDLAGAALARLGQLGVGEL